MTRASSRNIGKLYTEHLVAHKESSLFLLSVAIVCILCFDVCMEVFKNAVELLWWIHWPVIGSLLHFAIKQETDWSQSRTQSMVTSSTTYTPINGNILNYLHTTVLGPVSATLCSAAIL